MRRDPPSGWPGAGQADATDVAGIVRCLDAAARQSASGSGLVVRVAGAPASAWLGPLQQALAARRARCTVVATLPGSSGRGTAPTGTAPSLASAAIRAARLATMADAPGGCVLVVIDDDRAVAAGIGASGAAPDDGAARPALRGVDGLLVVLAGRNWANGLDACCRIEALSLPVRDPPGDAHAARGACTSRPAVGRSRSSSTGPAERHPAREPAMPTPEDLSRQVDEAIVSLALGADDVPDRFIRLASACWFASTRLSRVGACLEIAGEADAPVADPDSAALAVSLARAVGRLDGTGCAVDATTERTWRAACAPGAAHPFPEHPACRAVEATVSLVLGAGASPLAPATPRRTRPRWGRLRPDSESAWIDGLRLAARSRPDPLAPVLAWRLAARARRIAPFGPAAHRARTLRAESEAARGRRREALSLLRDAIDLARSRGFVRDAALIAERRAQHAEAAANLDAEATVEEAYLLYLEWGALAKARQLAACRPSLLDSADVDDPLAGRLPISSATLIKALQAIAAEVDGGRVADTLLRLAIEHTGACYGALLLAFGDDLAVQAQRAEAPELLVAPSADLGTSGLPAAQLTETLRTRRSARLGDAVGFPESRRQARLGDPADLAALSVPLMSGGVCLGVLYLEHDRAPGGFDGPRRRMVEVLAAQAANALTNARLFAEVESSQRGLRELNRDLERRVLERTRRLEETYAHAARLERTHAADQERQRLMRDLHDGLGSQLLATLRRLESGTLDTAGVRDAIVGCIADMRLVLDAAGAEGGDLLCAWASFRRRIDSQLRAGPVALRWRIDCPDRTLELGPEAVLDVLRIAQEAISNALRHARARVIEVCLRADGRSITLVVLDDGTGWMPDAPVGRGLANMRARAARLGGRLEISGTNRGVRVALEAPQPAVDRASQDLVTAVRRAPS